MKLFSKCIMAIVVIIVAITVSHINADHQNGSTDRVNDDGTGYKAEWVANDFHTAHATVFVSETRKRHFGTIPYIEKSESASFSTATLSSNGQLNVGAYFIKILSPRVNHIREEYEGSDSNSLYDCFATLSSTADKVNSEAKAHVYPDDDNDAGEIAVRM